MPRLGRFRIRVFPTPVGVFLSATVTSVPSISLPHARGGVSQADVFFKAGIESSPRPWGCFWYLAQAAATVMVFPTPVGVFLEEAGSAARAASLPHARGGVSNLLHLPCRIGWSSPRPWGCFCEARAQKGAPPVFPTPVGVFLSSPGSFEPEAGLPHARGGVSHGKEGTKPGKTSSPRPWGCFQTSWSAGTCPAVFPTPVGVFPAFLMMYQTA